MDAVEQAVRIIDTCRSTIPADASEEERWAIRIADIKRHLREADLRIKEGSREWYQT